LSNRAFYLIMAGAAVLVAAVLALFASSAPDGLERVAEDVGFADTAQDSAVSGSPLADYELPAAQTPDSPLNRAFAGVVGVAVTAGVAFALFGAVARGKAREHQAEMLAGADGAPPGLNPAGAHSPGTTRDSTNHT
jgi:hypothetical protein